MSSRVEYALRDPSYLRVANIIGIKNLDSNNDVDAIEDYIKKNGDPYQNALDAAVKATEDAQARSVQDLKDLTIGFETSIAQMNADFDQRYADLAQSSNARIDELSNFIGQQQKDFDASLLEQRNSLTGLIESQGVEFGKQRDQLNSLLLESQMANEKLGNQIKAGQDAAAAAAAEQQRLAANQANAYVPQANTGATSVATGDARAELTKSGKKNNLDELALLTGVGSQGNPLAGLQIA